MSAARAPRRDRRRPCAVPSGVRSELQQHVPIAGEAATVDDAVALIEAERPDVVLLDVHMPDGGGVEVIRRAAQRGDDAPPPCFLAPSVSDAAEDVIVRSARARAAT